LISIIYSLALSNFNLKQSNINNSTLSSLKQTLKNFEYSDKITIRCIDDEQINCLIYIDGKKQDTQIENLFKKCPDTYEYSKEQKQLEFPDLAIGQLTYLPICFEYWVSKNSKSSQMIVGTFDDVFIFDGISPKPQKIKYINDIGLYFDEKNEEIKNAF
jgi:hypothetical protein